MSASEGTSNTGNGSRRPDAPDPLEESDAPDALEESDAPEESEASDASDEPAVPEASDPLNDSTGAESVPPLKTQDEPGDTGEPGRTGGPSALSAVPRPRSGAGTPSEGLAEPVFPAPPPASPAYAVDGPRPSRTGLSALSPRYRLVAAGVVAVVAVITGVHLGMVFLDVAPTNTVTQQHGRAIQDWINPEFEQNWKLFAPNPLQQNIAVEVRAEIDSADGTQRTTGWYGLSAADGKAIDHNPVPSHTQQNELRRAWDFFVASHDNDNRPAGMRGQLSEQYLRRVVTLRLARAHVAGPGETVERVQIRSRTTNVAPPDWSPERISLTPVFRTLPWWQVPIGDATASAAAAESLAGRAPAVAREGDAR